jgi:hypothetical protein
MKKKSKVSPVLFAVSIVCFLLPFVTVSCNGQKVATFSGVQLAAGTTLEQPQMFGPAQKRSVDPEPMAGVAALCAIVGLGLSFLRRGALGSGLCGVAGMVALLLLKSIMDLQIAQSGQGMFQLDYGGGYILALLSLITGAAWNFYYWSQTRRRSANEQTGGQNRVLPLTQPDASPAVRAPLESHSSPESAPSRTAMSSAGAAAVCPDCGAMIKGNSKFCGTCGKPVGRSVQAAGD